MKYSLILASIFAGNALAAIGSTCRASAGSGTCKQKSSCAGSGFTVTGACPNDPASVLCCIQKTCNTPKGSGTCLNKTSRTDGTWVPGYCPGDSSVVCFVKKSGGTPDPKPPVTGGSVPTLNAKQSAHARVIGAVAKSNGIGQRGCIVTFATALQESGIRVLANSGVPASLKIPNDGVGKDHDSVGIFQQRPRFWGTVADCMDPKKSAQKFITALKAVKGWENMAITVAAQKVQRSAYPNAYAKHEKQATTICKAVY